VNRTSFRKLLAPSVAVLALSISLTACGGGNSEDDSTGSGSDSSAAPADGGDYADLSGDLAIGGASSQESAQNAWIVGFGDVAPGVTVSYDPIGSGGGRENFISGGFPMAGSDSYLTDDEGELSAATETCGAEPIEIPNYVSPIAIIFNVEGVDTLNLAPATLAGIFAGTITKWNDPAIVEDNPDAELPDANITPVHRSDESGTSENFTDYLDAVAGDVWTYGAVETWPTEAGGEGGKSTSGVVQVVTDAANTIGYADASQAGGLGQANIKVGNEYVAPSPQAAAKILEVSPAVDDSSDVNMAVDLDHETQESGVYPIVLTSYLLACQTYDDEATAANVKGYISYILSSDGQEIGSSEAGSAPLSSAILTKAQSIVDTISAG
jgi:phosphate transport system substrate-binding protein